jgi:nucleoside-triphosphate--adenylate kinase
MAAKAFKALILGPPGGGKGTLSKRLVRDFGFCHFSAGDALRAEIAAGSAIGNQAKDYIGRGALVPDELVTDLVLGQLENLKNEPRWLLDGFPRHAAQAVALDARHDVDLVLDLDIPEAEILSRLGGRRVHVASGRSYHIEWNPPKQEGIDDETGEPLVVSRVEINPREPPRHRADVARVDGVISTQVIRPDDTEEAIKKRLQQYHDLAKPLIAHYGAKVATFAGTESDVIYPVMKKHVEAVLG